VPAGVPPHKPGWPISPVEQRAAMVELAIRHAPAFRLSRTDIDRPGPHYTVDMLALLQQQLGNRAALWLIMGADSLRDLLTWRDPAGIVGQARLAVVDRRDAENLDLGRLEGALPGLRQRLDLVSIPCLDISSSDLRRRVREGQPIAYQVPEAVAAYIYAQGLYGSGP
jgi:nicotinate-nucleotide adenylyltransferase